jgi:hypothetical protein
MKYSQWSGYIALLLTAALNVQGSCNSEVKKIPQGVGNTTGTADEMNAADRAAFVAAAKENYPEYKTLKVSFTLKGRVNNEELYYEGSLSSTPTGVTIRMTDAIFLSPLLTLDIGKEEVTMRDHARNKVDRIPRAQYQWVELFGRSFPVRYFEPLMRGFLPDDATAKESAFARTPAGETLVRSDNVSFEAAMYFTDDKLTKIFYRDKQRGEILVFHLGAFFKDRNFPRTLKIEHSRTNDHLTLSFKGLRVTGEPKAKTKPAK